MWVTKIMNLNEILRYLRNLFDVSLKCMHVCYKEEGGRVTIILEKVISDFNVYDIRHLPFVTCCLLMCLLYELYVGLLCF
jgi:hypothetical protein